MKKRIIKGIIIPFFAFLILSGCGKKEDANKWIEDNLTYQGSLELNYATEFTVDFYDDSIAVIIVDGRDYYLIADNADMVPQNPPESINVITKKPNNIYVVGTGSMDYFVALDSLNQVKFSSLQAEDWQLNEVKAAMESNSIAYAGKYSAPDFELLISNGCDLVVENTMITHSPEILSQLKDLGFSTFVDYSSYENTALGRMEWVKLYGILTGNFEQGIAAFTEQESLVLNSVNSTEEVPSIGFFSVTAAKTVSVRKSRDYVCNMIELAGGKYGFDELLEDEGSGSTVIQLEAFYDVAKDCDILIYNSTIEGQVLDKSQLAELCPLIVNCKAYKDDRIYCTSDSFYQSSMELGSIIFDINKVINDEDDTKYLTKVK